MASRLGELAVGDTAWRTRSIATPPCARVATATGVAREHPAVLLAHVGQRRQRLLGRARPSNGSASATANIPPGCEVVAHARRASPRGRPGRRAAARPASARSTSANARPRSNDARVGGVRATRRPARAARAASASTSAGRRRAPSPRARGAARSSATRPVPQPMSRTGPPRAVGQLAPERRDRPRRRRTRRRARSDVSLSSDHRPASPRRASRSRSSSSAV